MEMDNWIAVTLMVALLIVGLFAGAAFFSTETEIEVPKVCEKCPECEVCEICEELIVEVPVPSLLDLAVADFMKSVADEEDEAGNDVNALRCKKHTYDFDEISVSRVYDDYSIVVEDDKTTVTFEVRLKYDEDDERSCRDRYNVEVVYEDDEDTLVTIL